MQCSAQLAVLLSLWRSVTLGICDGQRLSAIGRREGDEAVIRWTGFFSGEGPAHDVRYGSDSALTPAQYAEHCNQSGNRQEAGCRLGHRCRADLKFIQSEPLTYCTLAGINSNE